MEEDISNSFWGIPDCFWSACANGCLEDVESLLKDDTIDVNAYAKEIPIFMAIKRNKPRLTNLSLYILEEDAVYKPKTSEWIAQLHARYDMVTFWTPRECGELKLAQILKPGVILHDDIQVSLTPFAIACVMGHVEVVKQLLQDERININLGSTTPLFLACCNGNLDVVKLLLDDFRINIRTEKNVMPVGYLACFQDRPDIVRVLLEDGRFDFLGNSSFQIACELGRTEVVKTLLAFGIYEPAPPHLINQEIIDLIKNYKDDPLGTQITMLTKLAISNRWRDSWSARAFLLLLEAKKVKIDHPASNAERLFSIVYGLPNELVMIISNWMYGSNQELIPNKLLQKMDAISSDCYFPEKQ